MTTFSVAAIHPSKPDSQGWKLNFTADGFSAKNVSVRKVIQEAYGNYNEDRLIGGPTQLEDEKVDIEAKMDEAPGIDFRSLSLEQRRSMLQKLLADRFKLSVHHELKDFPVFFLVPAKTGPKLQEAAAPPNSLGGVKGYDSLITRSGKGFLEVKNFTMADLAKILVYSTGRIVIDKTGLTNRYDFSLKWTPMPAPSSDAEFSASPSGSGSSIFAALQEQLGLRLEAQKYPLEITVIDHLEKPSGN
jgi:uncharacterized protein (TIGR03435 family)